MQDAAASNWTITVTDADFEVDVLERSNDLPVVIDFWAEWCRYCHVLAPHLQAQANEQNGAFILAKVDVDANQEWAGKMQISGLPAVRVIRNQQIVDGFDGALDEDGVREFIKRILPSEADQLVKHGQTLELTNPTEAEQVYRSLLSTHPDHEEGKIGLARILVATQRDEEAQQILNTLGITDSIGQEAERLRRIIEVRQGADMGAGDETVLRKKVESDPENAQARYELGNFLAMKERYPEALEILLSAAELDKKLAGTEVRELMVKIFQIIGVRCEMSETYRDKLRAILY